MIVTNRMLALAAAGLGLVVGLGMCGRSTSPPLAERAAEVDAAETFSIATNAAPTSDLTASSPPSTGAGGDHGGEFVDGPPVESSPSTGPADVGAGGDHGGEFVDGPPVESPVELCSAIFSFRADDLQAWRSRLDELAPEISVPDPEVEEGMVSSGIVTALNPTDGYVDCVVDQQLADATGVTTQTRTVRLHTDSTGALLAVEVLS